MKPITKKILRTVITWAFIVFLIPQAFVCIYYFPELFRSGNGFLRLSKELTKYAFAISWVSAPVLTLLYAGFCAGLRRKIKGRYLLLLCVATGILWIVTWDLLVFPSFTWFASILPLLLCSCVSWGYAMGGEMARKMEVQIKASETKE